MVGELLDRGREPYEQTWELQKQRLAARQADLAPDALILVEHDEVITLGRRRGSRDNVLHTDIPVVEVERGGDVTYHGPGQLVGYPIVKLEDSERDLHAFLRKLEQALIAVCGEFGVTAGRREGWTGVWCGERKLVSIGIAVRRWVTMHGFALNVSTDLSRFGAINPCGLEASVMTSLSELTGRAITVEETKPHVAREIGAALGRDFSASVSAPGIAPTG